MLEAAGVQSSQPALQTLASFPTAAYFCLGKSHRPLSSPAPPRTPPADTAKFAKFHRGMLEHGVYLAPSQFEAGFTSLAHTEADIDATIAAAREVLKSL